MPFIETRDRHGTVRAVQCTVHIKAQQNHLSTLGLTPRRAPLVPTLLADIDASDTTREHRALARPRLELVLVILGIDGFASAFGALHGHNLHNAVTFIKPLPPVPPARFDASAPPPPLPELAEPAIGPFVPFCPTPFPPQGPLPPFPPRLAPPI